MTFPCSTCRFDSRVVKAEAVAFPKQLTSHVGALPWGGMTSNAGWGTIFSNRQFTSTLEDTLGPLAVMRRVTKLQVVIRKTSSSHRLYTPLHQNRRVREKQRVRSYRGFPEEQRLFPTQQSCERAVNGALRSDLESPRCP